MEGLVIQASDVMAGGNQENGRLRWQDGVSGPQQVIRNVTQLEAALSFQVRP
jgi:hypothetical protein